MAHCVTALIGKARVVDWLRIEHSLVAVELRDGWWLVPLDDEDLDRLGLDFSQVVDGFNYLSPSLIQFCVGLSQFGSTVYLETDYFGGMGSQGAAAFANGSTASPTPMSGDGAINTALRCIGIAAAGGVDEFDHIGLSRHRHTSDWKEAAKA